MTILGSIDFVMADVDRVSLSDDERRELEEPAARTTRTGAPRPTRRCARCSGGGGWLSDESLADVGAFLGMSVAELDSLATFDNMLFRRPVGRHVVLVCDSFACWSLGYAELRAEHRDRSSASASARPRADGRFTLLPIVCLGACDRGPAMMVDADLHGPVAPADVAGDPGGLPVSAPRTRAAGSAR